jgi:hypothetical protein
LSALDRVAREIEADPAVGLRGREPATACQEVSESVGRQVAILPEDVRRGEGRVAAKVNLDGWREPPEAIAILLRDEEGRLRQVHLEGHSLHPDRVSGTIKHANGRRVAGKGAIGEGVDLDDPLGHAQPRSIAVEMEGGEIGP